MPLGLGLSEKQIPQSTENTEKAKQKMELLESAGPRPRQARYQAALRPDMLLDLDSRAPSNSAASQFRLCAVRVLGQPDSTRPQDRGLQLRKRLENHGLA